MKNLLPKEGEVYLIPSFLSTKEAEAYQAKIFCETPWQQQTIKLFGKKILEPRMVAWYGDQGTQYKYSGKAMQPLDWNLPLTEIKNKIENLTNVTFNSVLLNLYRDEKDSMGWHRDNERELGPNPLIVSLSLGESRKFCFRHYQERKIKIDLVLGSGDLLLMKGITQHHWQHSLPKLKSPLGPRINLTFRQIKKV